jgi:hypothetical protein
MPDRFNTDPHDDSASESDDGHIPAVSTAPLFSDEHIGALPSHPLLTADSDDLFGPSPLIDGLPPPTQPQASTDQPLRNHSNRIPRGWVAEQWLIRPCCSFCGSRFHRDCRNRCRDHPLGTATAPRIKSKQSPASSDYVVSPVAATQHRSFKTLSKLVQQLQPESQQTCFALGRSGRGPNRNHTAVKKLHETYAAGRWFAAQFGVINFAGCILQRGGRSIPPLTECFGVHVFWWFSETESVRYRSFHEEEHIVWSDLCDDIRSLHRLHAVIILSHTTLAQPSASDCSTSSSSVVPNNAPYFAQPLHGRSR